jgi:transposase
VAWALAALVVDHLPVSRVAAELGVSWHTASDAVMDEARDVLFSDPARLDGVRVVGVDEHKWRRAWPGEQFVTVIIDLTPVRDGRGPARLIGMAPGRSKRAFKDWLQARPPAFRDGVEVVAMDGFTGFKTAAQEVLPEAVEVMDPFHVVKLAGDALDTTRQRVQRETTGRRGRKEDPLYKARNTLLTGEGNLTSKQAAKLMTLFTNTVNIEVEAAWGIYQRAILAYRAQNPEEGKQLMASLIADIATGVPAKLTEIAKLGRTLQRRATDILAYFDRPHTSNGPTEAINGRLEHLRGIGYGFRNITNYIARSLLECGGFKPQLTHR